MPERIRSSTVAPGVYEAKDALDRYLQASTLERPLLLLESTAPPTSTSFVRELRIILEGVWGR